MRLGRKNVKIQVLLASSCGHKHDQDGKTNRISITTVAMISKHLPHTNLFSKEKNKLPIEMRHAIQTFRSVPGDQNWH